MRNKLDILSEKRESGMALKKREFTPESGIINVDVLCYQRRRIRAGVVCDSGESELEAKAWNT